jgi:hypothetical protein
MCTSISASPGQRASPRHSAQRPCTDVYLARQARHQVPASGCPWARAVQQVHASGGPAAYLCTYLDNHGVKPEKVFKKAVLTGDNWDDPEEILFSNWNLTFGWVVSVAVGWVWVWGDWEDPGLVWMGCVVLATTLLWGGHFLAACHQSSRAVRHCW